MISSILTQTGRSVKLFLRRSSLIAALALLLGVMPGRSEASPIMEIYNDTPFQFSAMITGGPVEGPLVDTHILTPTLTNWAFTSVIIELNLSGVGAPDIVVATATLQSINPPPPYTGPGPVFTTVLTATAGGAQPAPVMQTLPHMPPAGGFDLFTATLTFTSTGNNIDSWTLTVTGTVAIPEPGSMILAAIGVGGLGVLGYRRRHRRKQAA
jgi:hypothetical protein